MEGVSTRAAANSGVVIAPLIQLIDEVRLSDHSRLLEDKLSRMEKLLQYIFNQFQDKQRSLPDTIKNLLQGQLRDCLNDAKGIVVRANRKKRFLDHLFGSARVSSTELRDWNTNCDQLFTNLERNVSIFPDAQLPEQLLQPVSVQALPEPNFVWPGITSAEKQLDTWLNEEDHQLRVIGIYGIGGIGKTSLLKKVYNKYKKGNVFQEVIWITVSKKYDILELQSVIANRINLKLGSTSHAESSSAAQMKLSSCLKEVKFLLFLDDMWTPFLQEESDDMWSRSIWEEKVGIPFSRSKGSKVVISSRSIDVIQRMGTNARYYMPLQLLFSEEGWQLFCRVAFKSGSPPSDNIKDVARKFATKCNGFPLAINIVAAAMACNHSVIEWTLALLQRKTLDSVLPSLTTNGIDELDLCEQIKWSYDHLPDSTSKNCFLYCAAFPEDEEIDVETLLEMWIGEGLFQMGKPSYLMDIGRRYVNLLVDRCLFEIVDRADMKYIKVHHVVRDMAILIGENEDNCLFKTTQCLQKFPANEKVEHCKRIAVSFSNIMTLPQNFNCSELLALILCRNKSLSEVPRDFFLDLHSLRVLDLSNTKIESLPSSMWDLGQLQFLKMSNTLIKDLRGVSNLSRLQFLHLDSCRELQELSSEIRGLQDLKHLNLDACLKLRRIPHGISELKSLVKLQMITGASAALNVTDLVVVGAQNENACSFEGLKSFRNLMELSVLVYPGNVKEEVFEDKIINGLRVKMKLLRMYGIEVGTMGTWTELRKLILKFTLLRDKVNMVFEELPSDMVNLKKLQIFSLLDYPGLSLPEKFYELEKLQIVIRHSSFAIRHSQIANRHSQFAIRHSPIAILNLHFAIHNAPLD